MRGSNQVPLDGIGFVEVRISGIPSLHQDLDVAETRFAREQPTSADDRTPEVSREGELPRSFSRKGFERPERLGARWLFKNRYAHKTERLTIIKERPGASAAGGSLTVSIHFAG